MKKYIALFGVTLLSITQASFAHGDHNNKPTTAGVPTAHESPSTIATHDASSLHGTATEKSTENNNELHKKLPGEEMPIMHEGGNVPKHTPTLPTHTK